MSVGINLPVKTTIFTDVNKFNGEIIRTLYSHEYTQAAGRAGRLGLDVVGHVIHLNNLFRDVDSVSYKTMMNGKPQILKSKFKFSYNLLLNLIDIGDNNIVNFASRSMISGDLENQTKRIQEQITNLNGELENMKLYAANLRTPKDIICQYNQIQINRNSSVNKKRKEIERMIQQIQENYKFIDQDKQTYLKILDKEMEISELEKQAISINTYIKSEVYSVLELLKEENFIHVECDKECDKENTFKLTFIGQIASQLRETHCLVFSRLINDKTIDQLNAKQLVLLFSCFTNITVQEDFKENFINTNDTKLKKIIEKVTDLYSEYKNKEINYGINTGFDYNIHYDLLNYLEEWCESEDINMCKELLQKIAAEKEIFLGEFVKALLKINNISSEIERIAEMIGNIELLSKLKQIQSMTLKYVVTNQSLYV
jgi:superfamily II RNA helicase